MRQETRDLGPDPAREIVGRDDVGGTQQPSQRFGPGRIRHALDATAPDDMRLAADPGREFLEQAGLPDAHFPANEHERSGVGHAAQRLAEGRERGLTPDEIRGPFAAPHDSSLWANRSERATSASRAPDPPFRCRTNTTKRGHAHTFCEVVRCAMVRRSRPSQDDMQSPRTAVVRNCERDIMKKIAIRIMTVGGGLVATLLAGGAWTRH